MFGPKRHTTLKEKTKTDSIRKKSKWSSFSFSKLLKRSKNNKVLEKDKKKLSKEDYIDAYIGNSQDWIQTKFSIPAAFFGPFYLVYRKLYKQAFIMILTYLVTYIYLPENIGMVTRLILNILMGMKINDYYLNEVKQRVDRIQKKHKDANPRELLEICQKQGGTLPLKVMLLLFILYIVIISLTTKEPTEKKQETQNIIINYDITYQIPKSMTIKANHTNYQHFIEENKRGKCFITVSGEKSNQAEEEYYISNRENYSDYTQVKTKNESYNQITWYKILLEKEDYTKEIYLKREKEIMYIMTFDSSKKDSCLTDKTYILNHTEIRKNF